MQFHGFGPTLSKAKHSHFSVVLRGSLGLATTVAGAAADALAVDLVLGFIDVTSLTGGALGGRYSTESPAAILAPIVVGGTSR